MADPIRVTVLHFGPLRELRGKSEETLVLPGPLTMARAYTHLFGHTPQAELPVGYARNEEMVGGSAPVEDGDVLAFLPPVGGG